MPFTDRFQLLDLKRDEGARTFEAREIATGRPVLVHLFADTTSPLSRALLVKLDSLPEPERRRILDRGHFEAGVYVVTDRLAEHAGLREWLKAHHEDRPKPLDERGAWQVKPLAAPPVSTLGNSSEHTLQMPAPPAKGPGAFTREFAHPVLRPTPPPPKPPQEQGEFTRLFSVPAPKSPPPQPAQPPGEFTQLFQTQARPPAPAPQAPPTSQPGEFTQMLQAQRPVTPAPANSFSGTAEFNQYWQPPIAPQLTSAPLSPPRPPSPMKVDGEYTQLFGPGDIPSAPPPNPAPPSAGLRTDVFPVRPPSPPAAPMPMPLQPVPKVDDEFALNFSKPSVLTLGQAPAGAPIQPLAQVAPEKRNDSRLPLLLAMGALVLLLIAIIVYLVIRSRPI